MTLSRQKQYNQALRYWIQKVCQFAAHIDHATLRRRSCPLCGSSRLTYFANNGALDYDRCARCTLIFMNPTLPSRQLNDGFQGDDRLVMEYFRIIQRFGGGYSATPLPPGKDNKLRDIWSWKKTGRLLDVGCALGTFLAKAARFYQVEGVEVNPRTAAIAAKRFRVHRGFLSQLRLPAVYDVVTLNQILYGVPNPVHLLRDIHKVLKRKGILYINTPNADSYAMQLYRGQTNHLYGYTTQQVFNRRSLESLAAKTGFRVRSFRTEWLDIYSPDILEFTRSSREFIHKRNCQIHGYEQMLRQEEALHAELFSELGENGNYLVAVLSKR